METCYYCGDLIEFRYVGGAVVPIHLSGRWCPAAGGGLPPKKPPAEFTTYESYVNPNASCPVCGARVFFYQSPHGGRVFFDDLGWPWPKHPCTDNPRAQTARITTHGSSLGQTALRDRSGVVHDVYKYRSHTREGSYYLIKVTQTGKIGAHVWRVSRRDLQANRLKLDDLVEAPSLNVGRGFGVMHFINARLQEISELRFRTVSSPA